MNIKKKHTSITKNESKKLNNNIKKNSHQSKTLKSDNENLHNVRKNNNQSKSDYERSISFENDKKRVSSSAGRKSKKESNCHFVTEEERAELLLVNINNIKIQINKC